MTHALASALRAAADALDRGDCPADVADRLARAVEPTAERRRRRDLWLRLASAHAGGASALHRAIRRETWRLREWHRRGTAPERATPLQAALFNAYQAGGGALPGRRMLNNVLGNGAAVIASDPRETSGIATRGAPWTT